MSSAPCALSTSRRSTCCRVGVTTWAPTAATPVLRCKLTCAQLSVISASSPEGQLYLTMQETAFDRAGVVAFLKLLLQEIDGKLLIIWEGAPIQRLYLSSYSESIPAVELGAGWAAIAGTGQSCA
jgi:hypothetical protein